MLNHDLKAPRTLISLAIAGGFAMALSGCGGGGGGSDHQETAATPVETACADLATQFKMAGVTVTAAKLVDPVANFAGTGPSGPPGKQNTGPLPAHCLVQGKADERTGVDNNRYAIGFEVRMPTTAAWNGRFYFQGGGGSDGFLATAWGDLRGNLLDETGRPVDNALSRGFAVATTDGGHLADPASTAAEEQNKFGADPQARIDYGYNAIARTTAIAKAIIAKRYGTVANKSYFVGCSNGGRNALVASQRLQEEFDGVYALNPGLDLPLAAVQQAWDTQVLHSLSAQIFNAFSQAEMNYVSAQILAKCDKLDGLTDGLIQDQEACSTAFVPATDLATCDGSNSGACLSAAQKTALANIVGGARDVNGKAIYPDFPWDAGFNFMNWRDWKLGRADVTSSGVANGASKAISLGAHSLPAVMMSPSKIVIGDTIFASPNALAFQLSVKTALTPTGTVDPEAIYATGGIFTSAAMSKTVPGEGFMSANGISYDKFKARGAKLIVAHGTSDPVFSSNATRNWYKKLDAAYGGKAAEFARYFPIPGMNHCSGGPATDRFDMVTALVNWVEKGIAPDSVMATSRYQEFGYTGAWASYQPSKFITPGITRPLCAYPKVARTTDEGTTWTCAK